MTDYGLERKTCTKDHPMPTGDKGFWRHPDAEDKGENSDCSADRYWCPWCDLTFYVEVGQ